MELKEKADKRALGLALRKAIRSETLLTMFEFESVEAVVGVRLENLEDFAEREVMPVFSEDSFHRRSPIARVVLEVSRPRVAPFLSLPPGITQGPRAPIDRLIQLARNASPSQCTRPAHR